MTYRFTPPQLVLPKTCPRVVGNWWSPNPAFVEELAGFLKGKRVLELFAGNGYLAGHLHAQGIDITATTRFAGHDGHERGIYHPVIEMEACEAVITHGSAHDVLLMCWPTTTQAAVLAAALWGSERDIVFIGEVTDYSKHQMGGCATDEFFERVAFQRQFDTYKGNAIEGAYVARFQSRAKA